MNSAILIAVLFSAADPPVVIEKATISWNELEKLLRREGASAPKIDPAAPLEHSISNLEVSGEIGGVRADLRASFDIAVLSRSWVIVPLIPQNFAMSSGRVIAQSGQRGILVRDGNGVSLVAKGEGNYRVVASLEGELEHDRRGVKLTLAPRGLTGGHAKLAVYGNAHAGGRTRWRTFSEGDARMTAEAALGAEGIDLLLTPRKAAIVVEEDSGAAADSLKAVTVVSLGGRGVTRISLTAKPGANRFFEATLPESAKLFKVWVGRDGIDPGKVNRGMSVRIPLEKTARIELAYTFEASRLGVRGQWHVELPELPVEVQGAAWDVWLPNGLEYEGTQSSMIVVPNCTLVQEIGATRIDAVGRCFGFSRPVLEPTVPYAEGSYRQKF